MHFRSIIFVENKERIASPFGQHRRRVLKKGRGGDWWAKPELHALAASEFQLKISKELFQGTARKVLPHFQNPSPTFRLFFEDT